jgi:hypothetical protein
MAALPEPWKSLRAKIEALAERIRKLENRSPFFGTGMQPDGSGNTVVYQTFIVQEGASSQIDPGGDIDINGNANVDGTLNVGGPAQFGGDVEVVGGRVFANYSPGVSGWQIKGDGSAEFNDLTVRNDSLQHPVLPDSTSATEPSGFTISGSSQVLASGGVVVPAGYSKCAVTAEGFVNLTNNSGSSGYVQATLVAFNIRDFFPVETHYCDDTGSINVASSGNLQKSLGGSAVFLDNLLPGDSLQIEIRVDTSSPWGTSAANSASTQAILVFTA